MKNAENISLVLLAVTAAVLTGLLVGAYLHNEPAYAAAPSVSGGDYVMSIGGYDQDNEFVWVINMASNQLILYGIDINARSIRTVGTADLSRPFPEP